MKKITRALFVLAAIFSFVEASLAADVVGQIRMDRGGSQDRRDMRYDQGQWQDRDGGGYWGQGPYGNVIRVPVSINRYLRGSTQTVVPDYDLNRF